MSMNSHCAYQNCAVHCCDIDGNCPLNPDACHYYYYSTEIFDWMIIFGAIVFVLSLCTCYFGIRLYHSDEEEEEDLEDQR